jgi:non-specific serine/threonine protein kinase/serine/threonine-protein kinase
MTPERWQQVKDLFVEAQQSDPGDRDACLRARCGQDLALLEEVSSLLSAAAREGGPLTAADRLAWLDTQAARALEGATLHAPLVGQRVGAYRILRLVGRGGMGEVYLAERVDAAYQKTVAIKVVRAGGETEAMRQRFHEERQILARLEHPNIARLIDAGATDDGRPFFVLEYVEGEPILQYCDSRGLPVRARLELFRTVCAAVHHAHQHLIVHRDLKPGNILVTADGQPKLLDFGIAKLLGSDAAGAGAAATVTALRFLTPDYASPEQVRGEPVTTAADVYSLGVVLYELLAGRRPFRASERQPQEALAAICHEVPPAPSTAATAVDRELRRQLTGDLDMVVLMALRKEPERRYASADQFAEDVRRHLAGLPVRARRDTLGYRAGKFARRHRAGVAAAVMALASLLAGVAGIAWQARVARAERARAERRFEEVRQLANAFIFDVHDAIAPLPGATKARQVVVGKALQYLDRLYQESSGDEVLQEDLAVAYQRVGDVQGRPWTANLGDTAGALASYERALALREAVAAGGDAKARRALSELLNRIGRVHSFNGDIPRARTAFQRSVAIADELVRSGVPDARRELLAGYLVLADSEIEAKDMEAAAQHQRLTVELAEQLHRQRPGDDSARDLARAYDGMVRVLRDQGRKADALELARKALDMDRAAVAARPSEAVPLRDLGVSLDRAARLAAGLHRADEAIALMDESLSVSRKAAAADPNNADAEHEVALAELGMAEVLEECGRFAEALAHHRAALAVVEKLMAKDPSATYLGDKAQSLWRMGVILTSLGRRAAALDAMRQCVPLVERLAGERPEDLDLQANLAAVQAELGGLEGPGCARSRPWLEKSAAVARAVEARGGGGLLAERKVSSASLSRQLARCAGR